MRLPGASEDTGALNCALLTLDGGLRLDHASGEGALFSIGPVSFPDECLLLIPIVAEMLESPPHFGPQRAYAASLDCLQLDLFFRYPRLGHVIINPLTTLGPYPFLVCVSRVSRHPRPWSPSSLLPRASAPCPASHPCLESVSP